MRATNEISIALKAIVNEMGLSWPEKAVIAPPKDPQHGDLSCNLAMVLSKECQKPPRVVAEDICGKIAAKAPGVAKVDIAGPGFLNFTFKTDFWLGVIPDVERGGACYGSSKAGAGRKAQVEFVSANPTGPLHIGHGRGAAVGDAVARLLNFAGFDTTREYYINDAGRQMRLLGFSVWLRIQELAGKEVEIPEDFYRGEYIVDIAREMLARNPSLPSLPPDKGQDICYEYAMNQILDGIKKDLADFKVSHNVWYTEKSLVDKGAVESAFNELAEAGLTYDKDGALWFATSRFGDDQDRVLRKSDGTLTYFASDIAYHIDKYRRGFDWVINVLGADHHGYVPRMRAAIAAIGRKQEDFDVLLIQLVNLIEKGQPISMSTRAGKFETLADVIRDTGTDAARFMFLYRKSDSPLDFDLDLVKQRTMDNPVYYVQYAHARICSVMRRAEERGLTLPPESDAVLLAPLGNQEDLTLLRFLERFEDTAESAALALAPHHISHYLMELAACLHSYYSKHQVLVDDNNTAIARLLLLRAVKSVLRNGLDLVGVEAPEIM